MLNPCSWVPRYMCFLSRKQKQMKLSKQAVVCCNLTNYQVVKVSPGGSLALSPALGKLSQALGKLAWVLGTNPKGKFQMSPPLPTRINPIYLHSVVNSLPRSPPNLQNFGQKHQSTTQVTLNELPITYNPWGRHLNISWTGRNALFPLPNRPKCFNFMGFFGKSN